MPAQSAASSATRKPASPSGISTAHRVVESADRPPLLSLTALYLTALGLIALWTAASQVLLQGQIARQAADARLADADARQQMLAERLCRTALMLKSPPASNLGEASHELDDAASALASAQAGLQRGDAHHGIRAAVEPRALVLLKSVAPSFTGMMSYAHQIQHIVHRKTPSGTASPDLAPACQKLLASERGYLSGMEAVATEQDREAQAEAAGLRQTSLLLNLCTILLLGLEALFLFKPMARHVKTQLGRVKTIEARIAEQNAALELQSAELTAHQNAMAAQETQIAEAARSLGDAELRLNQAADRFHAFFHGVPVACYSFDSYGRVVAWNKACEALYKRPATEALQQPLWELITPPHDWDAFRDMLASVLRGAAGEREWEQMRPDGSRVSILSNTFPVHGPGGEITGGISANLDLSARRQYESYLQENSETLTQQREALEQANARLRTLAAEDGVTGLKNHRSFHEGLTREFARVMDSGCREPLSVVMMDVDAFKQYNENFGHAAGDDVLRRIAQILLKSARGGDIVSRYGGEEFAVILGQTDRRGAMAYAERVRASIASAEWSFQAVTASVGVTTLSFDTPAAVALIAEAEAALRRSKDGGRNRVTFAGDAVASEPPAGNPTSATPSIEAAAA